MKRENKGKLKFTETRLVTCLTGLDGTANGILLLPVRADLLRLLLFYELTMILSFFFPSNVNKMVTFSVSLFQPFGGHSPIINTDVSHDLCGL